MTNPDNGEGLIVTHEHFSLEMHQKWVQLSASRHHNEQIMAFWYNTETPSINSNIVLPVYSGKDHRTWDHNLKKVCVSQLPSLQIDR